MFANIDMLDPYSIWHLLVPVPILNKDHEYISDAVRYVECVHTILRKGSEIGQRKQKASSAPRCV